MRYYSIEIRNRNGELIRPKSLEELNLDATYTSWVNNQTLPQALNIEMDIPLAPAAQARNGSYIKIWGCSREEISQANDLSGCSIIVYGGMKKGLPLAKPSQSQIPLVEGNIYQAFGNWEGTSQSLDLVLQPATGTLALPVKLTLDWKANTTLASALKTTLETGFPKYQTKIAISDSLKTSGDQPGTYPTLQTLASEIKLITNDKQFNGIKPLGGGAYNGVDIYVKGRVIFVVDGTQNVGSATISTPLQVLFEDMIGQPTWIGPNLINFKTVMRSDLSVADYIKLPANLASPYVLTTPGAAFTNVASRSQSTFKGNFYIREAHQFGNFRQADARSWVTSFNALAVPTPANPLAPLSTLGGGAAAP